VLSDHDEARAESRKWIHCRIDDEKGYDSERGRESEQV